MDRGSGNGGEGKWWGRENGAEAVTNKVWSMNSQFRCCIAYVLLIFCLYLVYFFAYFLLMLCLCSVDVLWMFLREKTLGEECLMSLGKIDLQLTICL